MSHREAEILEQQRRVAARLHRPPPQAAAAASAAASAAAKTKRPSNHAVSSAAASTSSVIDLTDSKPTSAAAAASVQTKKTSSSSSTTTKRPTVASSSSSSSTRKRPTAFTTKHHKTSNDKKPPTSAAAVLAQARSRLEQESSSSSRTNKTTSKTTTEAASSLLKKRKSTSGSSSSQLSKWMSSLGSSSNGSASASAGFLPSSDSSGDYGQIEPEDFWRNLRDWDVLTELAGQQQKSAALVRKKSDDKQQRTKDGADNNNKNTASSISNHKALPDTFVSHRHYMAAWAPLCLAETRAQILQEVMMQKMPQQQQKSAMSRGGKTNNNSATTKSFTGWIPVHAKAQRRADQYTDCVFVQLRPTTNARNVSSKASRLQTYPHDVFVLIPDRHAETVQQALLCKKDSAQQQHQQEFSTNYLRKCGLVGHAEQARQSVDGLVLKVARKWWANVHHHHQDEDHHHHRSVTPPEEDEELAVWWLWPLGSNVTALREFTALCRVESLPLRRYLVEPTASSKEHGTSNTTAATAATASGKSQPTKPTTITKPSSSSSKHSMISAMGGVAALGKGFAKYAKETFNTSQLEAIAASASDYGEGGFTLIKGPPGTGKTTTLVAVLNSLHIRQFNKYYEEVRRIAGMRGGRSVALHHAVKNKPRLLVCAPSNAAVDNVILKIMEKGFMDGSGNRYNPSIIRVGVGQSLAVKDVALEAEVDAILAEHMDAGKLESSIAGYKMELQRIQSDIARLRLRLHALAKASPWPLSKDWEIRIDEESFEQSGRCYFVNHKEKTTTFEVPPPPEPDETQFEATAMPEYRSHMAKVVKLVESYNSVTTKLERCNLVRGALDGGNHAIQVRQQLETHILDSVHIVMTTLGTAGNRVLESAAKFEVVVVDEAAQSVEPATLTALQLGSRHAILVGDPQQLPATIFNVSGRHTKYDRSLFQRLEEAGHKVYMLNMQYRMHPQISHFPRKIFYGGNLLDGPNVRHPDYGNPLRRAIVTRVHAFQPFTILDLDSTEERGGTSLANLAEALLAVHLYSSLKELTGGLSAQSRVAVITPYSQQTNLLRRQFSDSLGPDYAKLVEVNTVDGFQGREANIVIFSCVRAAGSHGIGFLSDVRRMNVALTRAKFFMFVIARCQSIVVNPYWRDLVDHARENQAVVPVHMTPPLSGDSFPPLTCLRVKPAPQDSVQPKDPRVKRQAMLLDPNRKATDPRKRSRPS